MGEVVVVVVVVALDFVYSSNHDLMLCPGEGIVVVSILQDGDSPQQQVFVFQVVF